jgi:hypothetical protein
MMTDDDLDRALFSLPLAEPPAGLRASILGSTVFAPRPLMRTWETVGIGVALALVAWLLVAVWTTGGPVVAWTGQFSESLIAAMSNFQTLVWLSCGASIAAIAMLFDPRLSVRRRS